MPVWLWIAVWVAVFASLAALYVLRPVWQHQGREVSALERRRSELLARQETVLTALRELDLDYAVGKLPEEAYRAQRAVLLKEGAQVLRELDTVEQRLGGDLPTTEVDQRLEALLEQRRRERARVALTEQNRTTPTPGDETLEDMLEDLLLARRQTHRRRFAGFCPHCGAPYMENDRFCGKCGRSLTPGHTASRKRRGKSRR